MMAISRTVVVAAAMLAVALCIGGFAKAQESVEAAIREAYEKGYRAGYADGLVARASSSGMPTYTHPQTEIPREIPSGGGPIGRPAGSEEWWEFMPPPRAGPGGVGADPGGGNTAGFE